ncbi:MAG: hypothetical protein A2086_16025 [Spirochaetes bacterium GWD1_27_9]|nr:MAG: hypothetical protein A2Y34_11050 [Spirochaetes bacterium GWC1_27_15]OHD36223.1 MAG: hypothetical protein A2086_16025 [Spirochaetes bacterium GWD1_27_9]
MRDKINIWLVIRLYLVLIFWSVVFFPVLFIPRKFHYKTFWIVFIRLFLFGIKVRPHIFESEIDIKETKNVIFASTHKTFADTYFISYFLRHPFTILFREGIFKSILFKFMCWRMSLISIDMNNPEKQKNSFEKLEKMVKDKYSIIMFPEGWYVEDKPVGNLKRGVAKMAKDWDIGVVPIAIYGLTNSFSAQKDFKWRDVYLSFGKPIKYSDFNNEEQFLSTLKSKMGELYLKMESNLKGVLKN